MEPLAFAAARQARLKAADELLTPWVREGLSFYAAGEADWMDGIIDAAAQIWLENYQAEAPGRAFARPLARFRTALEDALEDTDQPFGDPEDYEVNRVAKWLSTYATNAGTTAGAFGRGIKYKRWTTMQDASVREEHRPLEGTVVPIGSTFTVEGVKLAYPGEPKGPPELWINCRCVLMPANREGEAMSANTYVIGPDDQVNDDNPDVELGYDVVLAAAVADPSDIAVEPVDEEDLIDDDPEDDEELITEIPVHGVLAPEGVPTGDGRQFALESLSTRDLPVPLRYEFEGSHGGDNSRVATIGRVDEAWRDEASNMWRWRGAIVLNRQYAQEAIDGMIDGTVRGVSIDGDDAEIEIPMAEDDAEALDLLLNPGDTVFTKMRVSGLTIVPIPAFQEAYIALGHEFQEDLSPEEQEAQIAALQACGCLDGWGVIDLTDSAETDPREALQLEMLTGMDSELPDDVEFRDVGTAERKKLADSGAAMPDGSYPIANCEDLRNAIQAIGRAKDPDATKRHIRKRKAALGCDEVELPEDWTTDADVLAERVIAAVDQQISASTSTTNGLTFVPSTWSSTTSTVTFAPGTKDGPGWITHPIPTARIRRYWTRGKGAAKIGWGRPGDFNRCRRQLSKYVKNPDWLAGLCANMHYEALGFWPAQHHGARVLTAAGSALAAPVARLAPNEAEVYPQEWFQNPSLERALPLRVERDTRRIYGYVAEWGTCHVGVAGFCQDVPRSYSDYGYFKKGLVRTEAGEQPVGVISYGNGHADPRARMAAATAHYDQPDAVRAYVNVGEDEYGIWFAGVLAPWVSDPDIDAIQAIGAVSGDWREIRGQYELIGVPVVNTPGFPLRRTLAASAGRQISMIGVGALAPEREQTSHEVTLTLTPQMVNDIAAVAVSKMMHQQTLAARVGPARATVRSQRLAAARARLERD